MPKEIIGKLILTEAHELQILTVVMIDECGVCMRKCIVCHDSLGGGGRGGTKYGVIFVILILLLTLTLTPQKILYFTFKLDFAH